MARIQIHNQINWVIYYSSCLPNSNQLYALSPNFAWNRNGQLQPLTVVVLCMTLYSNYFYLKWMWPAHIIVQNDVFPSKHLALWFDSNVPQAWNPIFLRAFFYTYILILFCLTAPQLLINVATVRWVTLLPYTILYLVMYWNGIDLCFNIDMLAHDLQYLGHPCGIVCLEHKYAVKTNNRNNGIAVHAWDNNHQPDWDAAETMENEPHYWKRRVLEAIWIKKTPQNANLDCGLTLSDTWTQFIHK